MAAETKGNRKVLPSLVISPVPDQNLVLPVDESLKIDDEVYPGSSRDFIELTILGEGARGVVYKCVHKPSNHTVAVKKIACPVEEEERKPVLRELAVCKRAADCPYMVNYYGAFFGDGDVWLCMELMDLSLDKFYKVLDTHERRVPENFIRKVAIDVVNALEYLHRELHVIHRDVKPSNILLNRSGSVKLCDYSISGYLVNSLAQTMGVGFYPYMAPERIKPDPDAPGYDVKSDIWSLGITLIELATGKHPYSQWKTMFQSMNEVVDGPSPRLPTNQFTDEFDDFINCCVKKRVQERPNYATLLQHPFIAVEPLDNNEVLVYVRSTLLEFASDFGVDFDESSS